MAEWSNHRATAAASVGRATRCLGFAVVHLEEDQEFDATFPVLWLRKTRLVCLFVCLLFVCLLVVCAGPVSRLGQIGRNPSLLCVIL